MKMIEQIELKSGFSPNKIWFTSDTHFFHDKVVEYSQRPFAGVEEMNEGLIARWNSVWYTAMASYSILATSASEIPTTGTAYSTG